MTGATPKVAVRPPPAVAPSTLEVLAAQLAVMMPTMQKVCQRFEEQEMAAARPAETLPATTGLPAASHRGAGAEPAVAVGAGLKSQIQGLTPGDEGYRQSAKADAAAAVHGGRQATGRS